MTKRLCARVLLVVGCVGSGFSACGSESTPPAALAASDGDLSTEHAVVIETTTNVEVTTSALASPVTTTTTIRPTTTIPPTTTTTIAPTTTSSTTSLPPAPNPTNPVDPKGSGVWIGASWSADDPDLRSGTGTQVINYSVATEAISGIDPDHLARFVQDTLADPRGWNADNRYTFQRVESGGLFTLVLASPTTVDRLCAPLNTNSYFSCAANGWAAINLDRWNVAIRTWDQSLLEYRTYVINHEIGHHLGQRHVPCPAAGEFAPIMMQQTKGLDGCVGNGWPTPG